uniref:Uncharacterized protein n=1 Tax=Anguilla anguilla TaxID=7936 RepID=A0A0E9SLU9_ANGAN
MYFLSLSYCLKTITLVKFVQLLTVVTCNEDKDSKLLFFKCPLRSL